MGSISTLIIHQLSKLTNQRKTQGDSKARDEKVQVIVQILGVDAGSLTMLIDAGATEATLNEYGRFDELKGTIDKQKAKTYLDAISGENLSPSKVNIKAATLLRKFLLEDDFELERSAL